MNMDQLGMEFKGDGSVMTPAQRQEQRRKRGECVTCGEKCFQKKLFRMFPITVHGKVLNGRCLNCHPLDVNDANAGVAIQAVSRPATEEDLQRFRQKQERLNKAQSQSVLVGSGSSVASSSTGSQRPGMNPRAASSTFAYSNQHIHANSYDRAPSNRSLPVARSNLSSDASVTSYQSFQSENIYRGPERSPEDRSASPVSHSSRSFRSLPAHRSGSRESLDVSQSGDGRYDSHRRPSNPENGLYVRGGDERRRRSNPDLMDGRRSPPDSHLGRNPSREELRAAMERILGYQMDEEEAYALMSSGMEPAQILDDLRRKQRGSQHSNRSFDDDPGYSPSHGVLNRGGAVSFPTGDQDSVASSQIAGSSYATGNASYSNRSLNSNLSGQEEAMVRQHYREGSSRSIHSDHYASDRGRAVRRGSGSSAQSSRSYNSNSRTSLQDHFSRHSRTSDLDDSAHGDAYSTGALSRSGYRVNVSRRRSDRSGSSTRDDTEVGLDRLNEVGPDFLAIVSIMRDYPGSAEVQLNCMEELSNFNFADEDYDMLLDAGAMEVIADAMQAFPQDMVLQMSGCRAMCNTSGTPEAQECYAEFGAVDLVLDAMGLFLEYPRMQEQGLAALANLAATQGNIPELIDKGCVPQAVAAMNKYPGDLEVQLKGCSVITNLSSHALDMRGAIMEASGGGAVVLAMVLHSQEPDVQEKALRALRNLSSDNDDVKVELAHMGGIDGVVQAMQVHRDDAIVQEAGASTLCNLAGHPDNKLMIGQCGGIDVTIRAMWVHSDAVSVVEWCCRALFSLSLDPENRLKILEVGGITAAVNAMQAHAESAVVQEFGCAILCSLAKDDESAKEKIVAEEALDAIVLAMVLFSDDVGVQERACLVLLQLANETNLKSMQASNVGELALAAASRFPSRCEVVANELAQVLDDLTVQYNNNNAAIAAS